MMSMERIARSESRSCNPGWEQERESRSSSILGGWKLLKEMQVGPEITYDRKSLLIRDP